MTDPLQSNSYAIAYRLLGSRPAALAASGIAVERVRQRFDDEGVLGLDEASIESWLPMLVDFTVEQSVEPGVYGEIKPPKDEHSGLREALRRRLVRASRLERVNAALVHLSGYSPEDVASMLNMEPARVQACAKILAPPPGVDYRALGDPELVGERSALAPIRRRVPYPSTIVAIMVLVIVVLMATRCQGARPTLVDEGALSPYRQAPLLWPAT